MISGLGVDTVQKFGRPLYRDGVSQSLSKVGPTLRAGQCHRSLRPPPSLRKWRWRSGSSDFDNFATASILL